MAVLSRRRAITEFASLALTLPAAAIGACAPTSRSQSLQPEMFGAGSGGDDTAALQSFLDRLGDGVDGILSGQYKTSAELHLTGKRRFSLSGGGRITIGPGVPVQSGYGGLRVADCAEFTLSNLSIDGNREKRTPRELPAHNFIFESCRRFRCDHLNSENSVVDGFMLYSETPERLETHCSDFVISECSARQNWRQGCSVVHGRRGRFLGGFYSQTRGTNPSAGIDLEADGGSPPHSIDDIVLRGVRFEGNDGFGLLVSGVARPRAVRAIDCVFVDNARGAISWSAESGEITRPIIEGFGPDAWRGAIDFPAGPGGNITVAAPVFRRTTAAKAGQPLVYVHAQSAGAVTVDRLSAADCAAVAAFWASGCKLSNSQIESSRATFDGAILIYGSHCSVTGNTISDFYGAVIYAPADDVIISSNRLSGARHNGDAGCINVMGKNPRILDNTVATERGATAIAAPHSAIVQRNQVSGFRTELHLLD